jgi:hypothetical protein
MRGPLVQSTINRKPQPGDLLKLNLGAGLHRRSKGSVAPLGDDTDVFALVVAVSWDEIDYHFHRHKFGQSVENRYMRVQFLIHDSRGLRISDLWHHPSKQFTAPIIRITCA